MSKKNHIRQQTAADDTKDIANIFIPGPCPLPPNVRTAIEYVAHTVANTCSVKHGQTALFWHLIHVVSSHINQDDKS